MGIRDDIQKHPMDNFLLDEFNCPCCGANAMKLQFLRKLDAARNLAGIPFKITSGFRCEKWNDKIDGEPDSRHLIGEAADIRARTSEARGRIIKACQEVGLVSFSISKKPGFVHVDTYEKPWIGLY